MNIAEDPNKEEGQRSRRVDSKSSERKISDLCTGYNTVPVTGLIAEAGQAINDLAKARKNLVNVLTCALGSLDTKGYSRLLDEPRHLAR